MDYLSIALLVLFCAFAALAYLWRDTCAKLADANDESDRLRAELDRAHTLRNPGGGGGGGPLEPL